MVRFTEASKRLANLYAIVGESRAYRAARMAYLRELANSGMPIEAQTISVI
jgi:hypothetical protein